MLRLALVLAVLLSFAIRPNNGAQADPNGGRPSHSQITVDGAGGSDPNG